MNIVETHLPGVVVFEPKKFGDSRGFFVETWRKEPMQQACGGVEFVQDNHSRSRKGVLRGLHYQMQQTQGKLVRVASGCVYDVAVDVRQGSAHFGEWYGCELSEDTMKMMYVPPGFAHGFVVLSDTADFIYKCTDYYHPQSEQGILWNDPDLGIEWPMSDVQLSEKDQANPQLKNQTPDRLPVF